MSFENATPDSIMNYTGGFSTREPFQPLYTTAWVVISATIIIVFMIFGTVANALTIAVIRHSRKLRTKYYTFILSMCVSDLISALLSPLFLYRRTWGFEYFAWPDFLCKLYWGFDYLTSFVTALHILSFAILRLIGIQWPTVFRRISSKHVLIWLAVIWTIAFFGGLVPHTIFNEVKVVDRYSAKARWASCSVADRWFSTWQLYIQFAYPIFLYIPAIGVILISFAITVKLFTHKKPGDKTASPSAPPRHMRSRKDKQIVIQLMLIVGSFLLGYTPVTAFHWFTGFTINEENPELNKADWQFAMIQYLLLRFSECLNPVFYNLASPRMREETMKFVKNICSWTTRNRHYSSSHVPASNITTSGV